MLCSADRAVLIPSKARRFGFHEAVDSEEMLMRQFAQFQKMRFIPG